MLAGKVDLMLVIGTRASVWPAAGYIEDTREKGARIAIINTEEPEESQENLQLDECDWVFRGDAADIVPEILKDVCWGSSIRKGRAGVRAGTTLLTDLPSDSQSSLGFCRRSMLHVI